MHNTVRTLRKEADISQYRLAKLTKISRFRISLFECGYLKLNDLEIEKIKATLKKFSSPEGFKNE